MLKYVARRLLEIVPTTVGILLLTFALFNVVGIVSPSLLRTYFSIRSLL